MLEYQKRLDEKKERKMGDKNRAIKYYKLIQSVAVTSLYVGQKLDASQITAQN